jgi:hypothetical protein
MPGMRADRLLWMCGVLLAAGCGGPGRPGHDLTLLTEADCQHARTLDENLDYALRTLGWATSYTVVDLSTLPPDDARRGYGTPTILVNGADLFGLVPSTATRPSG